MATAKGLLAVVLLVGTVLVLPGALAQDDRPRRTANVSLQDEGCPDGPDRFCVQPSVVTLEEGTDLVLRVTNEGRIAHNLTFAPGSPSSLLGHGMNRTLEPNETQRLRIPWPAIQEADAPNATLTCGQDGHAALGETLTVNVPSLAASEEQPQPFVGPIGVLAAAAAVALLVRRRG